MNISSPFENGRQEAVMRQQRKNTGIQKLVLCAILTAIVIILQLLGSFIRLGPFSITLVLVPIVIGAAMNGPFVGGWLGFVFGLVVLLSGDAAAFLSVNELGTIVTVLAKGTLAGLFTGFAYKLLEKFNTYFAVMVSAIVCPLVNTGIFLLGCKLFFMDTITDWAAAAGSSSVGAYMILGLVGANFLVEMAANVILAPSLVLLLKVGKKILK